MIIDHVWIGVRFTLMKTWPQMQQKLRMEERAFHGDAEWSLPWRRPYHTGDRLCSSQTTSFPAKIFTVATSADFLHFGSFIRLFSLEVSNDASRTINVSWGTKLRTVQDQGCSQHETWRRSTGQARMPDVRRFSHYIPCNIKLKKR